MVLDSIYASYQTPRGSALYLAEMLTRSAHVGELEKIVKQVKREMPMIRFSESWENVRYRGYAIRWARHKARYVVGKRLVEADGKET